MDMMIEAMKVAYSKSKPKPSGSSLASNASPVLPILTPSSISQFHPLPALTKEAIEVDMSKSYSINFIVKFYGSGLIRHYSDFGGSQVVMDRFVSKAHRFAANLRNFARKSKQNSKCMLVFTQHDMQLYGEKKQVSIDKIPLDQVYAVHPHPTKNRVFGILADHMPSGTVHCFCFSTTGNNSNTDVLCAFRESCMHWLSNNLSKDPEVSQSKEVRNCEGEEIGEQAQATGTSEAEDRKDVEGLLSYLLQEDDDVQDIAALKIKELLDSDLSTGEEEQEDDSFLKKVSFARHSLRYPAGGAQSPEKVTESDQSSAYLDKTAKDAKDSQKPWLQTRPFSSPPPPRSLSPTPIIKSRQTPPLPACTDYSLDAHGNWAISAEDKYNMRRNSPSSLSPAFSNISIISGSEIIAKISNSDLRPDPQSRRDSIPASVTSDYYSPFDSLYDYECDKRTQLYKLSLPRSSSAPSFLICATTNDQVSHYLADDSTIEDFKAYLLNISDIDLPDKVKPPEKESSEGDDEKSSEVSCSHSSSFKSLSLMLGSSQNKPSVISKDIQTLSSDDEASVGSPKGSEVKELRSPPVCGYRDIALSELLDRIYPPMNTTLKSSEDSMSPSPQHESHFRFTGLVIRNDHTADKSAKSHQQTRSYSVTTSTTEKSDSTMTSQISEEYVKVSLDDAAVKPMESLDTSCGSTSNMPSTLMLHDSELEEDEDIDDDHSSNASIGHTYSVHGSDSSSAFTIPSLPLDRIQASPSTASASSVSTPISGARCGSALGDTSGKESADTSSEMPSTTGSNDENLEGCFYPKQGSSSDYYSECLSQPAAGLINDSADISTMTIPSLPLANHSPVDENSKSTARMDSSSEVPLSPEQANQSVCCSGKVKATGDSHLQMMSEPALQLNSLKSVSSDVHEAGKVNHNSALHSINPGSAPTMADNLPTTASPFSTQEKSITITIPTDMFSESDTNEGSKSESAIETQHADKKPTSSTNFLTVPPLKYTSDTSPYNSANIKAPNSGFNKMGSSLQGVECTGTDASSNERLSTKEESEIQIPSLSLKITAWSSERDDAKLHKVASTPAKIISDKYNSSNKKNSVAITVMEPPRIICEGSSTSGYSDETQGSNSFNSSLKYVTEMLESSHNSLAKAVQSLSKKAVIKQSNISLELVLPLKDYEKFERDARDVPLKMESHLAKLQLNSSTYYTTEDSQLGDQDDVAVLNNTDCA